MRGMTIRAAVSIRECGDGSIFPSGVVWSRDERRRFCESADACGDLARFWLFRA